MNEEKELRDRLARSISVESPELPQYLVAQAATRKPGRIFSVSKLRLGLGSLASIGALSVSALVLPGMLAPAPLFTIGTNSQGAATMASSESVGSADAKMSMIWPGYIEYNYNLDALSNETGKGKVYQAELIGTAAELMAKLQEVFGVSGEMVKDEWSTDSMPSYTIQSKEKDSVEAYLNVYWSGTGTWYFSRWDQSMWSCGAAVEGEEPQTKECAAPTPTPELIPSEANMRKTASELFEKLGSEVSPEDFKIYRDDWGASAWADLKINGTLLPVSVSVGWDSKGVLSSASGHSFRLIDRGEFGTVSAKEAGARIKEGRWYGSAPSSYYEGQNLMTTARAQEAEISIEPGVAAADQPATKDDPAVEENPEPKIIDMVLTKSEATTLGVWDANGGFWLVPGYVIFNDQGWFDSIISLEDGVIQLPSYEPAVPMIEPAPATEG